MTINKPLLSKHMFRNPTQYLRHLCMPFPAKPFSLVYLDKPIFVLVTFSMRVTDPRRELDMLVLPQAQ
jgi:hypothetical protein